LLILNVLTFRNEAWIHSETLCCVSSRDRSIYLVQQVARDRRPLDQVTNAMIATRTTVDHGGPARPNLGRAGAVTRHGPNPNSGPGARTQTKPKLRAEGERTTFTFATVTIWKVGRCYITPTYVI